VGEDRIRDAGRDERLTVADAAERLSITKEAVRKRISRKTLRSDKDPDGTVRVYVPSSGTPSGTASGNIGRDELVEALRDQIEDLRRERDEWREQARVADRLLSAAMERIPAIEAPSEPQESPETVEEEPQRAEPRPATGGAQEGAQRRSWLRRMFGTLTK
jgi:hypothetical protein